MKRSLGGSEPRLMALHRPPKLLKKLQQKGPLSSSSQPSPHVQRRNLPIHSARYRLLQEIRRHETVIVIGETGSGKTTQIPQYLLEWGFAQEAAIAVTQPRRVAAITIAGRVAIEKSVELGTTVGYSVRFEDVSSPRTKIKYLTDGMLLREAMSDPLMKRYSVVILDEAHERTLHTDILLGIVKTAQAERRQSKIPLKIIVMSATMDVDTFSNYFQNCPVLYVEGRQFPIQIMYTKEAQQDYLFSTFVTVFQIHQESAQQGDILIFLTGQEEIESVTKSIRDIASVLPRDSMPLLVYPLYASLPSHLQMKAFSPTPQGCRKVIVATNVAETSITISGIKYVIDAGYVKMRIYNYGNRLESLKSQRISKAQAWQRSGRAGRQCSGICYRLYTEEEFSGFKETTVPEIQRCSLASVILQMLVLGIADPFVFDFIDKPNSEAIEEALNLLLLLGAVKVQDESKKLSDLGRRMAKFPVDPKLAKIILASEDFGCTEEILTVVSMLSVESVTYTPLSSREEVSEVRKKFSSNEGDLIMFLNIYHAYKNASGNKQWCEENFVHARNMKVATEIRKQLVEICDRCKLTRASCHRNYALVRKCMVVGLFTNAAELQPSKEYKTLGSSCKVSIHPSSCLFSSHPSYVLYSELVHTNKTYMRNLCLVDLQWLLEVTPDFGSKKKRASKLN